MSHTSLRGTAANTHRIDLPGDKTGFTTPPVDVHIKFLPPPADSPGPWTLLAHAAAGKPDILARWLRPHPGILDVQVAPGIAPKLLRAKVAAPPPAWMQVASFVKVHHLDLGPDGHASWFVEGVRDQVWALVQMLEGPTDPRGQSDVRCRPVHGGRADAPISRRQFETLSVAVALGYYEIPHRIDLRTLASRTGVSLGSASELLRRAEAAVLTHYVDSSLMGWPGLADEQPVYPFRSVENIVRS
ncbi:MAG TPA: helix-turn-helix domain-containing protein [Candidatus Thermoplasmatota archaeon]|nr:helix-turn-helix domain-containing protein [Candidatus Thermoplasmatota archaeon]